ncbi:hypothetical protein L0128_17295 [candidate division KSB1 bacterium]|nr:hypothetical protein [candidate division KSB1 bacterium]
MTAERNQHQLPSQKPIKPEPFSKIKARFVDECSGMVRSRQHADVYWIHNDSGDEARIFAINQQGELIQPANTLEYRGIPIADARNIDWEDITTDDSGNLIIGDTGNNDNRRQDLAIYLLSEPDPTDSGVVPPKKIRFYYPDQHEFPPEKRNFDAEAIFWANGKIYLLTKHRSDNDTKLYRFDSLHDSEPNQLTLLDTFNILGQVTAADASPDGKKLAVLTYNAIWMFESVEGDDYFHGNIHWLPIQAGQCEAICFDGDILVVSNEGGKLYRIPLTDLLPVMKSKTGTPSDEH